VPAGQVVERAVAEQDPSTLTPGLVAVLGQHLDDGADEVVPSRLTGPSWLTTSS
jgi:hypothetical protein